MSSLHLSWAGRREDARGGGGQEEEEEEAASRRIIILFVWDATTKAKDATATHLRHRARPLFAISTTCEYSGSQSYSAIFHSRTPSSSYIVSIFDIARAAGRGAGTNCGDVTRGEIRGGTKRHDTRAKPRNISLMAKTPQNVTVAARATAAAATRVTRSLNIKKTPPPNNNARVRRTTLS